MTQPSKRYIYTYREKESGRAVYVGSTYNVKRRDISHCAHLVDAATPIEREIARRGRDAFTLEVLEEVSGSSVDRENHWMDELATFHTPHGLNQERAKKEESSPTSEVIVNVRIPNSLATRLAEHKQKTLVPTSAFVRRAIEEALTKEESTK